MKIMWLTNTVPGEMCKMVYGEAGSGMWLDHVLEGLRSRGERIHVLCRGKKTSGALDDACTFTVFGESRPQNYEKQQEELFVRELQSFQPDVIHIWGTEYAHCLAMLNACDSLGLLDRTVVSIQGLCSVIAGHYAEGIPDRIRRRYTFRDFVRQDNIIQQAKMFSLRGIHEIAALKKARHVIGRTDWDRACMEMINPDAVYHFCNETLRPAFYRDGWSYDACDKYRIFASNCSYPVKGFHYLLEAFAQIVREYPQAVLSVPGRNPLDISSVNDRIRQGSYAKYLAELIAEYNLEGKVQFLGGLSEEEMKSQFLRANVFVLPSTVENSPNSLGEAMLLGTPCVAADVGGVSSMMVHEKEGFIYQSTAPYMLAHYIRRVFAAGKQSEKMGAEAQLHARNTHAPEKNLDQLLSIYLVAVQS